MRKTRSASVFLSSIVLSQLIGASLYAAKKEEPVQAPPPPYDADLFCKNKSIFFVTGEFLVWHVNEGAVDYAVKMDRDPWSATANTYAVGEYENANFGWSPGLRGAFGHFNAPHFWDVYAQYTYVPCCHTTEVRAPSEPGRFLNGTWIHPDVSTVLPLARAKSHMRFDYNVLDILFSRRFHTNEHLRFNVFGGGTSAFIYQNWLVTYVDTVGNRSHIRNKWQFLGAGVRLGLKLDWFICNNFYLTGLASNAVLAGWYRNSAFQTTTAPVAGANNSLPLRDAHFSDTRLTYNAQFLAGPSWQKGYTHARLEVMLGYELVIWTNLHQIYRSTLDAPTGFKETFINDSNVSLQGVTLRFNVDF